MNIDALVKKIVLITGAAYAVKSIRKAVEEYSPFEVVSKGQEGIIDKAIEWCDVKIKEADESRVSNGQEFVSEKTKATCFYEAKQYLQQLKEK